MEVVQRPFAEEDRVREGAVPGREAGGPAVPVGDLDVQEPGLYGTEVRPGLQDEAVAVRGLGRARPDAARARVVFPPMSTQRKSWKFRCGPAAG
jgi:hypothetical protein